MKLSTVAAQTLWLTSQFPAAAHFSRALRDPASAQDRWLRRQLRRDFDSTFGREHDFAHLKDYRDFVRRVPLSTYRDAEPWIVRIRDGEQNVLTNSVVSHLVPTSGTSAARKLIPFTSGLQRNFSAAVGPWLVDLARQRPSLAAGPGYWSISPVLPDLESTRTKVRVGFADDADYLPGIGAWLVRQALVIPSWVRHIQNLDTWRAVTMLGLLRRRDLRLISIWHPSFFDVLIYRAEEKWEAWCAAIAGGTDPWSGRLKAAPDPRRARELSRLGPGDPSSWWPELAVVSCWGEQAAAAGWHNLRRKFPRALVQAKGLLATEAIVTLPWRGATTLAVTSHFFEFLSEDGSVRRAHELERGKIYEVIVTNGGGLWRYQLGDRVECVGHCFATPCLHFLGRSGHVSDLRGEKLSETFVEQVLEQIWPVGKTSAHAELHARTLYSNGSYTAWYELHTSLTPPPGFALRLENALCENPHYALARKLGQLEPARVVVESSYAEAQRIEMLSALGGAKPRVLVTASSAQ